MADKIRVVAKKRGQNPETRAIVKEGEPFEVAENMFSARWMEKVETQSAPTKVVVPKA